MLSDIFKFVQSHLTASTGFVAAFAGGAMLLAVRYEYIARDELVPGAVISFAVLLALGVGILIVHGASYAESKIARRITARSETRAIAAKKKEDDDEALRNLVALIEQEHLTLLWLMRRGQKRFGERSWAIDGLVRKKIVHHIGDVRAYVYEVNDAVWKGRDDYLKGTEKVQLHGGGAWPKDGVFYIMPLRR